MFIVNEVQNVSLSLNRQAQLSDTKLYGIGKGVQQAESRNNYMFSKTNASSGGETLNFFIASIQSAADDGQAEKTDKTAPRQTS